MKPYLTGELTPGERVVDLPDDDLPVVRPFVTNIQVCYLVDDGAHFSYLQNRDLTREGVSADALHTQALERLRQIAQSRLRIVPHGKIYAIFLDGNFESSLLLLDGLWDKGVRHVIEHEFVAALPARDILAFCDSESTQGLAELRELVNKIWPGGDHLITRNLYCRRNSVWQAMP